MADLAPTNEAQEARDAARVEHQASRALDELEVLAALTNDIPAPMPPEIIRELLAVINRGGRP